MLRGRNWLNATLRAPVADYFFMYCITVNTLCLAVEHHDQPRVLSIIVNAVNKLFTLIFAAELAGKLICFGPSFYTTNIFNAIDASVVIFT